MSPFPGIGVVLVAAPRCFAGASSEQVEEWAPTACTHGKPKWCLLRLHPRQEQTAVALCLWAAELIFGFVRPVCFPEPLVNFSYVLSRDDSSLNYADFTSYISGSWRLPLKTLAAPDKRPFPRLSPCLAWMDIAALTWVSAQGAGLFHFLPTILSLYSLLLLHKCHVGCPLTMQHIHSPFPPPFCRIFSQIISCGKSSSSSVWFYLSELHNLF